MRVSQNQILSNLNYQNEKEPCVADVGIHILSLLNYGKNDETFLLFTDYKLIASLAASQGDVLEN